LKVTDDEAPSPSEILQCGPCRGIFHFSGPSSEKVGHPCSRLYSNNLAIWTSNTITRT